MDFLKSIITQLILLRPNHSSVWITLRYAFVAGVGLMTTIALTRWLSPETYGTYQYFLALIAFFSFFSLPGFNAAALKAVAEGRPYAIFRAIRYSFLSGWLIIPSILLWVSFTDHELRISIPWLLLTCILSVPFYALNTWYAFYEGKQNFTASSWRVMLATAISFLVVVTLASYQFPAGVLLAGYFLSGVLTTTIFCLEIFWKTDKDNNTPVIDVIYGYKVTLHKLVLNVSETIPLLLIGAKYGPAAVAIFQVAYFIYSSFSGYLGALTSVLLPRFFLGFHYEWKRLVIKQGIIGTGVGTMLVLITIFIFPMIFHESYKESQYLLFFLVPFSCLLPLRTYLTTYFSAKEPGYLTIILLVANGLAITMFFLNTEKSFIVSGISYLGTLTVVLILFLIFRYFSYPTHKQIEM